MRILVVEDDHIIASGIEYSLQQEGYGVLIAGSKADALAFLYTEKVDVCLLDITLPDGTGYDICRKVKERSDIPVIFLTALDDEVNVVMGLDFGADDYIVKPFRIRELISRIKSVNRRYTKETSNNIIKVKNIEVNLAESKVVKDRKEIIVCCFIFYNIEDRF
jgi:DNA-binding response OmpR family regulator